jgi:hypothetical protein
VQVFEFFIASLALWNFVMRHVFGFCACRWFTCLLMLVCLLNACVFTAYSISCISCRVYMVLNSIFCISLLVLSSITKKGEIVAT